MTANFKKYVSIILVLCLAMVLGSLVACKEKEPQTTTPEEQVSTTTPGVTTPEVTTPEKTTPEATTPDTPTETVTFPSDEESDPKQEDIFFE